MSEGFATAWETELGGTMIALKMNNLPEGVNLRWPLVVNFVQDPDCMIWKLAMCGVRSP